MDDYRAAYRDRVPPGLLAGQELYAFIHFLVSAALQRPGLSVPNSSQVWNFVSVFGF